RAGFLEHYLLAGFFYSLPLRTASFKSPTRLCASPLALSSLPSVCSSLSPVTLPAASLIAPLALSAAPLTCSRSIYDSCVGLMYRQRAGVSDRSIKRKNAASGGIICATKNLVCVPNSRRRRTAEPRITILLSSA